MRDPTNIEKILGSLPAKAGLTLVAAAAGTPLAALVPLLSETLAGRRHNDRVESALAEISTILQQHEERLANLTDPQYKLLNETVLAILQCTEDEKLAYLRSAIARGVEAADMTHTMAAQTSRALRDMTAGELGFVVQHAGRTIIIGPVTGDLEPEVSMVDRNSLEMSYLSGLLGLGALVPAGSTIDDGGRYVFPPFIAELRELVQGSA